jgi:hypothetical protein
LNCLFGRTPYLPFVADAAARQIWMLSNIIEDFIFIYFLCYFWATWMNTMNYL